MIGTQLRYIRKIMANETQQEMADRLGVTQRTITNWETDKRSPDFDMLAKICDFYNVSMDFLFGRTSDPTPPSSGSITDIAAHTSEPMTREDVQALVKSELTNIKKELENIRKELQ